jgi:N utilization substance protein A
MAVSANRLELLQIADAVAREKVIDRQIVLAAMEDAIAKGELRLRDVVAR